MAKYINDRELYYEIVLSKGKGQPTEKLKEMFYLISINIFRGKNITEKQKYDAQDIQQSIYLHLYKKYNRFDHRRYDNAFPFITEIAKRAGAFEYNQLNKYNKKTIRIESFFIDGKGINM